MLKPLACKHPLEANHAELYDILISKLTDYVIFLMDRDGCIMSWNPGVERTLGYAESEWVGQSAEIIFTPEDRASGIPQEECLKRPTGTNRQIIDGTSERMARASSSTAEWSPYATKRGSY